MDYERKLAELTQHFYSWNGDKTFKTPQMTNNLYPYKHLFTPITINKLTVKNRVVMAPMGNVSMCDETGKPNEQMIAYFEERAKGGVGLITTGLIPVSYGIDPSIIEKGGLVYFPRIDRSRTVLAGWRDLASRCQSHGAKVFVQLSAGLGRVGNPQCLTTQFKLPKSASFNPNFYISQIPCFRLSDRKITKIIKNLGQAAADAKAMNLNGVYLHAHEGYLIEQLQNTAFNRRKIGKYANWKRFGIDTIKHIRERCGNDFPIMYRIDLSLALNLTYKDKMDTVKSLKKFKNERKVEECLSYMADLVKAGVDLFDVDLGCYDNWWLPHPPATMPPAPYVELAKITKEYFEQNNILTNTGKNVPVVAVGKLGYPDEAERVLQENYCDMVMLGRPLLADPEWCNKAYANKVKEIVPCIGCQEACINEFVEAGHPQCAVNPRCAFEHIFAKELQKAPKAKNIAVIGAGPSGITACKTLLERGHKVTLFEKENQVGGMVLQGSVPKNKYEFRNYLLFLQAEVEKLKSNKKFNLRLSTQATLNELKSEKYDVIITACGSKQRKPKIDGIDRNNVFFAVDILADNKPILDAKKIAIIGGGVVGCETAQYLRYELNKEVVIVEMTPYFMNHTCTANRGHLIHSLEEGGVELLNCAKLNSIGENFIAINENISKTVPNPYCTWAPILPENIINPLAKKIKSEPQDIIIPIDAVILSTGIESENLLYSQLIAEFAAPEIYNIGDSLTPAKVMEAVRSAYRKAKDI